MVDRADDVQGFADALDSLADARVRRRMGTLARERVEDWSWPNVISRLRESYVAIVASKRGAEASSS